MNILSKFIDWQKGAENALKWFSRILSAFAEEKEKIPQTEQRLFELYGECKSPDNSAVPPQDEFSRMPQEALDFLPVFYQAWRRLTERERCILREFYLEKNETTLEAVMRISSILNYERSRIYDLKKEALLKLSFLLFKHA